MTNPELHRPMQTPSQNPWYLLATLNGPHSWDAGDVLETNKVMWNRYFSPMWSKADRKRLKTRVSEQELVPFNGEEMTHMKNLFRDRIELINNSIDKSLSFLVPSIHEEIDFSNLLVEEFMCFDGYIFPNIDFHKTIFLRYTSFRNSTFLGHALFDETKFHRTSDFSGSHFLDDVSFIDADLKAPFFFSSCHFVKLPPQFAGATLHEGTVWRAVTWPSPPTDPYDAGRFTDAYERLKLEMDRLKKHEDELMFFGKELECRRVAAGQFRGLPISIYGTLCHYGQSYLRPLVWLLALILIGAVQFWPVLRWDFLLSLGVSTANALGPFGLRKELVDPEALNSLSRWLQVLTGAQMVLGPVLLFLIGLGLRNRFRMK